MMLHFLMRVRVIPNLQTLPADWRGEEQEGTATVGGREDIVHPTEPDFIVNGYIYVPRNNNEGEQVSAAPRPYVQLYRDHPGSSGIVGTSFILFMHSLPPSYTLSLAAAIVLPA